MKTSEPIDIIGAGIGGLTTAIALERAGFTCRIFEQADELKPVGAGILLAINAMQVYERLGLRDDIERRGNHITAMTVTTPALAPISKANLASFEGTYGARTTAIHRGALQQALLEQIETSEIVLGYRLTEIEQGERGTRLTFDNGEVVTSAATIGADGIHSTVRTQLFPDSTLRDAHQNCWRGVADSALSADRQSELIEAWGDNSRFGFVQIAEGQVYWYAIRSDRLTHPGDPKTDLKRVFSDYDALTLELLDATRDQNMIHNAMEDLRPIPSWHTGTICLIGDAAHAATPNLGQGACQAIEDADILSQCLTRYDLDRAFAEFGSIRRRKARRVVTDSWNLGKIAHLSNPVARAARNRVMRATSRSFNRRRLNQLFQLATV